MSITIVKYGGHIYENLPLLIIAVELRCKLRHLNNYLNILILNSCIETKLEKEKVISY